MLIIQMYVLYILYIPSSNRAYIFVFILLYRAVMSCMCAHRAGVPSHRGPLRRLSCNRHVYIPLLIMTDICGRNELKVCSGSLSSTSLLSGFLLQKLVGEHTQVA